MLHIKRTAAVISAVMCFSGCGNAADIGSENIIGPANELAEHSTPSVGQVRMPVFMVDFPDERFSDEAVSEDELSDWLFGETNSMAEFEKNASYSQLELSGSVFYYTAKQNMSYYKAFGNYEELAEEVLSAFDGELNYSDFDSDNDGYADVFTMTIAGQDDFFYGCQATWYDDTDFSLDGEHFYYYIVNDAQPYAENKEYFIQEMCHEFGHCMGLADYYKYDANSDFEAMNGIAGTEKMDEMEGDYSQFSKLMLGWLKSDEAKVYTGGKKSYKLSSSAEKGSCVIIPVNCKKGMSAEDVYTGEYFLIQYDTAEKNMKNAIPDDESGIRIFHIDAEICEDEYGGDSYFKYNGFSQYYDTTHTGRRIIRLVNDGNGYFHKGDVIDSSVSGFAWYDENGRETIGTGLIIKVTGDGRITISQTKTGGSK